MQSGKQSGEQPAGRPTPFGAPRSVRVSGKTDRSEDRREGGRETGRENVGKREKGRGAVQTVRTTSVEIVHREGWKGIRGIGEGLARSKRRRLRGRNCGGTIAVPHHLGVRGDKCKRARRDAPRRGCGQREWGGGEKDTGEEDGREGEGRGGEAWKSLEKLGESPRCSRFSLTRG